MAAQAALVDHRAPGASAGELVCLHDADGPATVCMMHPVEGLVNAYAPLAAKLGEVSFHALQSAGLDGGPLRTAFPDMVTAALEAVEGLPRPLLLGGWSMGAFLAWETARRLLAGGQIGPNLPAQGSAEAGGVARRKLGPHIHHLHFGQRVVAVATFQFK